MNLKPALFSLSLLGLSLMATPVNAARVSPDNWITEVQFYQGRLYATSSKTVSGGFRIRVAPYGLMYCNEVVPKYEDLLVPWLIANPDHECVYNGFISLEDITYP